MQGEEKCSRSARGQNALSTQKRSENPRKPAVNFRLPATRYTPVNTPGNTQYWELDRIVFTNQKRTCLDCASFQRNLLHANQLIKDTVRSAA
jgi:hypothetical protein